MAVISGMTFSDDGSSENFAELIYLTLSTSFIPLPIIDPQNDASLLTLGDDVREIIGVITSGDDSVSEVGNGSNSKRTFDIAYEDTNTDNFGKEASDETYVLSGANLLDEANATLSRVDFNAKTVNTPKPNDTQIGYGETQTYKGFIDLNTDATLETIKLRKVSLTETRVGADTFKVNGKPGFEQSETFTGGFEGDIDYVSTNNVSGRIDKISLNYVDNEVSRNPLRESGISSYKEKSSLNLVGNALMVGMNDGTFSSRGSIKTLKMDFDIAESQTDSQGRTEERATKLKYDNKGQAISLEGLNGQFDVPGYAARLVAALLANDDQITGTSDDDVILGLGGTDTYTWDIRKDGSDDVILANITNPFGDSSPVRANEAIDNVVIKNGKDALQVTFNDDAVGNGLASIEEAVTIQLGDTIGRFDDEGMRFSVNAGSLTVNGNEGMAALLLGTNNDDVLKSTTKRDYLVGGDGADRFEIGKTGSKLVVNAKKETVTGFDVIGDLSSEDKLILSKTDLSASSIEGTTSSSFDTLFDALTEANAYFKGNKALLKSEGASAAAQKSSHFFVAVADGDTYLFEDATNAGKTAQLVKLVGIVEIANIQGALGLVDQPV